MALNRTQNIITKFDEQQNWKYNFVFIFVQNLTFIKKIIPNNNRCVLKKKK